MDNTYSDGTLSPTGCIDTVTDIVGKGLPFDETIQSIADLLPLATLHPTKATARISHAGSNSIHRHSVSHHSPSLDPWPLKRVFRL